jgi:YHS domain-containing protein
MKNDMKLIKHLTVAALTLSVLAGPLSALAGDKPADKSKEKVYPLTTCVVSGEKLGEMGKPYTFTQDGQEIQLCCKSCLKDFKKDPAKYVKKLNEAKAKDKKA